MASILNKYELPFVHIYNSYLQALKEELTKKPHVQEELHVQEDLDADDELPANVGITTDAILNKYELPFVHISHTTEIY